ncbi:pfs domain-containing protein [Fusarium oxysporum f. sp. phaseoli]
MADLTIYTVGWICAIEAELNAAVLFLDDEHDPPEDLPVNDNNSYVLGRIGKHNIVIAALPFGEYGLTSAATVARDMVRSFPNVRIGLMVGIGGGAPTSLNDIRLGDVVVGSPGSGTGGIFQYDYGKTIQDANFVVTRHLNQPPQFLLTALSSIKGQYTRHGHQLESAIDEALTNNPIELPGYCKPPYNSDRLFVSAYKHVRDGQDCLISCTDSSQLVFREGRKQSGPKVHFGAIASANQLMKDAIIRDRLSAERNVLCFEMEAAGLINHFPCLVIRGICDYSDTHKNKEWQGYAAMVAAAFAKDLLRKIAPNRVEAEKKLKDAIETVSDKVDVISATVNQTHGYLQNDQARERFNTILKWMAAPNVSSNLNKAIDTRQEGSGQSLIQSEIYRTWKSQVNSFLWLNGIPGSGKTILSATVIEDLKTSFGHHAVIYYYFDFSDGGKQTFENALRSFICQLYGKFEIVQTFLNDLYDTCTNGQEQPSMNSLQAVFAEMARSIGELWIVLDALDECSTDERSARVLPWIKELSNSKQFNTHVFVTSRPELDIEKGITAWGRNKYATLVANKLIAEDICAYVKAKVRGPESKLMERWKQRDDILNKIETALLGKANGM